MCCKPGGWKGKDSFEVHYDELEMSYTSRGDILVTSNYSEE